MNENLDLFFKDEITWLVSSKTQKILNILGGKFEFVVNFLKEK